MAKTELASNKEVVQQFWNGVFNQHNLAIANALISDGYIQHNPRVETRREVTILYQYVGSGVIIIISYGFSRLS
ncbi:hypothetical protein [Pelosinus propionicus]|uniref:Uncharacterized protein n=1 Tax=Pelosinus propionicus DSM 13327 TaxID=1123291 RepID=A0A1I4PGB7_9FIRM|nr:hypothetical protein [Pelosinus propionicus]SFM26650.1 hypothetical protein SAMN04490355_106310 [Pelosinus propionicus DSM 13327]